MQKWAADRLVECCLAEASFAENGGHASINLRRQPQHRDNKHSASEHTIHNFLDQKYHAGGNAAPTLCKWRG